MPINTTSLIIGTNLKFATVSTQAAPGDNLVSIYAKPDGKMYSRYGSSGEETIIGGNASLTIGTGLLSSSGSAYNSVSATTLSLTNTGVTAGTYSNATLVVDAQGRITSATANTAGTFTTGSFTNDVTIHNVTVGTGGNATSGTTVGVSAGKYTGVNNTAIGYRSQASTNSSALRNTAVGADTLQTGNPSFDNVAIGYGVLNVYNGSYTTGVGSFSLYLSDFNASYNTGLGYAALYSSKGTANTGIGSQSLRNIIAGANSTAVGANALYNVISGGTNTAVGSSALYTTTGSGNVALGYFAGKYETGSNKFYVDNQDRTNTAGDKSQALLYGTFASTAAAQSLAINAGTVAISGNVGVGTTSPNEKLSILDGNFVISKTSYGGMLKWTQGTSSPKSGGWEWGDGTGWRMDFGPSATPRLSIFDNGNVGIGTTSPETLLHIKSTTAWTQPIFESTLTTGGAAVLLKSDYTTWQLAARGSANDTAPGSFSIYDSTANAIRMFINTSGQTGVGRIPSVPLDVEGWGRFVTPGTIGATNYGSTGGLIIRASAGSNDINYLQFVNNDGTSQYYHLLVKSDSVMYTSGSLSVNGTLFVSSLSIGTQGGTIDEYTGNQALRIYSNTAGKSLWVGFPGGITLNNDTTVTGTINGLQLTSSVSDNFKLFTKTNTPNPNWTIGYGNGLGGVDTAREYIFSNAGTISINSGSLSVTGSTTLGSYLGIGSSSGQTASTRYSVHESSATSLGTAATPNQKIRWTWYNDADGAIVGTRQYQLWVYPYSNQSGSLAIFDSVMAFSIPTYTETALNVSSVVSGTRYVITSLGNTSQSQWNAMAGTSGNTYVVNNWFNAVASGPTGTTGTVISFAYTKQVVINAPTILNNSLSMAGIVSITGATTIDSNTYMIIAGGTSSYAVTLPSASTVGTGRMYVIKKTSTSLYTLTINTTSSQTIDGGTSLAFTQQYASYTVISNGSNWLII